MNFQTLNYHDAEILISQNVVSSVIDALKKSDIQISKKASRSLRAAILKDIFESGWSQKPGLSYKSKISITAFKDGVGLCFQTGNVSRIYADLLKLQTLWASEKITAGIVIVPVLSNAKALGSNIASFERLKNELTIFSRVITMPLLVIGFDGIGGKQNA